MKPIALTQEQQDAIDQVNRIMKQNFDSFLLTYRVTNEDLGSKINHEWHGHISDVVGLATIAKSRMVEITSLRGVPNG